jgi:hypothetical protein
VTLVHGGPYDRHADRLMLGWDPSGQWLATAGYAVFLPNQRGGKGHRHDFAVRVAGAVGLDEWTEICTGIDLLIAGGVADPEVVAHDGRDVRSYVALPQRGVLLDALSVSRPSTGRPAYGFLSPLSRSASVRSAAVSRWNAGMSSLATSTGTWWPADP